MVALPAAGHNVNHPDLSVHQLQGVAVAGDQQAPVSRRLTACGQRPENVVCLISRQFQPRDPHCVQQFLQNRHLYRQVLRHRLALGFVKAAGPVAEGRLAPVKGYRQGVRSVFLQQRPQNGQETVYRIRRGAVGRIQHAYAVIGAVYQAVPVNGHQRHQSLLLSFACFILTHPIFQNNREISHPPVSSYADFFRDRRAKSLDVRAAQTVK